MANLIDPIIIVDDGRIIFNTGMVEVTKLLVSKMTQSDPGDSSVLYAEKVLGGYSALVENDGNSESAIDLELLFNAVIDQSGRVRDLFNKGVN